MGGGGGVTDHSGTLANVRDVVCFNDTAFVFQKYLADTFLQTDPSQASFSIIPLSFTSPHPHSLPSAASTPLTVLACQTS